MKKILLISMFMVLLLVMAACGGDNNTGGNAPQQQPQQQQAATNNPATTESANPTQSDTATTPNTQTGPTANLSLPLVVTESTFMTNEHGMAIYRITTDGILQSNWTGSWEDIDTNVRSFLRTTNSHGYSNAVTFFIKNDNALWGFGNNRDGRLGDGTGMDRDEPVHILDNVAQVYSWGGRAYALQVDGTLMTWGNGNFEPVFLAENVVNMSFTPNEPPFYQTNNGTIYTLRNDSAGELEIQEPVYAFEILGVERWYINSENVLVRANRGAVTEIAAGVEKLFTSEILHGRRAFILKQDGSLWGIGDNERGELGDGTRVPRDEPVWIADNVAVAQAYGFLKHDGTFWSWNQDDPTPQQLFDNVAFFAESRSVRGYVHFQDGRLFVNGGDSRTQTEFDNVRIPRTFAFN